MRNHSYYMRIKLWKKPWRRSSSWSPSSALGWSSVRLSFAPATFLTRRAHRARPPTLRRTRRRRST
eukprot:8807778-Heterocapsa_arctica.AAC.1